MYILDILITNEDMCQYQSKIYGAGKEKKKEQRNKNKLANHLSVKLSNHQPKIKVPNNMQNLTTF